VRFRWWLVVQVFAAVAGLGCGGKPEAKKPAAAVAKPAPKPAVLVGSIRLEPGRELPSFDPAAMERSVLAHVKAGSQFPDVCSPAKPEDRMPVRLTPDGKLTGVMLAASEFSHSLTTPPAVHAARIRDCRLTPSMIVARVGDTLRISNETNFPMMPGVSVTSFNEALTVGSTRDVKLDKMGVQVVMCGFSAPCGRTDVVVVAHSYTAVTDDKGEFRIENFPADETVRINAWHPLFFDTFQSVRVGQGEEKRIELVLTPRPPPEPPKPVVREPGVIYPD